MIMINAIYNRSSQCNKCGERDATTQWLGAEPELMQRRCRNCDYVWLERPRDSEEGSDVA
jgi:RNA polymerase subunit RPABC4/transcription elongation factor Spt4